MCRPGIRPKKFSNAFGVKILANNGRDWRGGVGGCWIQGTPGPQHIWLKMTVSLR